MKKLSIFIGVFCLTSVSGQKLSDYKYVLIPEKFQTFKNNQYGLDILLVKALKGKKYSVLKENKSDWPAGITENPCSIVTGEVLDDSNFLKNRVLLQFKDCNNNVILASKGSSSIKEYEEGFGEALERALAAVPVSTPVNKLEARSETKVISEKPEVTKVSLSAQNGAQKFSNGSLDLQKIQIDSNQFILADPNSSIPYAAFKTTTKRDVFRVKLANGDSTIGYFEGGNIIIEIPQANGEYSKEIFSVK